MDIRNNDGSEDFESWKFKRGEMMGKVLGKVVRLNFLSLSTWVFFKQLEQFQDNKERSSNNWNGKRFNWAGRSEQQMSPGKYNANLGLKGTNKFE